MFESIVAKITNTVRNVVRAVGDALTKTPWLASLAIIALFLML